METIRDENDCGFERVSSFDNAVEDNIKVNMTLELKPQASAFKKSYVCFSENSSEFSASRVKLGMITESVYNTQDNNNCNNSTLIFTDTNTITREAIEKTVGTETTVGNIYSKNRVQNDYSLVNSCGNNVKSELASEDKYVQSEVNECDTSETILLDKTDSFQTAVVFSNDDSNDVENIRGCNEHESMFHESEVGLYSDGYDNVEGTSFSKEIHLICENQEDFFSEHVLEKECCSNHSCHHTTPGLYVGQSSNSYVIDPQDDLKHETALMQTNINEEFHCDQYENIEFSNIFSSVDIYQQSFYQSYNTENTQHLQENIHNFINDLDSQSCEKSMTNSGVFGLSLSDTGSSEFIQSDDLQYSHGVSSSEKLAISMNAVEDNSILFKPKPEILHSTPSANSTVTNDSSFSDPNTKLFNHLQAGHQEFNSGGGHNIPSASTATLNSAALSFHYNQFEKSPSECCAYDSCLIDYNKNYQKCLYDSPQDYMVTCPDWNSWSKESSTPCDIDSPFICSKQPTDDRCSVSSTVTRGSAEKPEIAQFLQLEVHEDEETDDADEIDYLPLSFNTKNEHWSQQMGLESVSAAVYYGDNSCASYSPLVLTPPPSASSTPVPSSSQDNCNSDDVDLNTHWPVSHYDTAQIYSSSTLKAHACKLKSEQLDTSLLSFGLSQGTKRPFPSMADVMRNSRSKSASHKKCADAFDQQPRRSGRPRKSQIQSDKISTTATSNKQKRKSKSKCDMMVPNDLNLMNSYEDQIYAGSSRTSGAARHNEPLNQHAIEIMTQWFENHIDNPYPIKADKENMATQGGITENQVKSWFANKRNRTNNTKPKVQKRAMEEKLKEIFRDLKRNHQNPMADNSHVIQQLSGIIQRCHSAKLD